jgi:hypothetical protein
MVFLTPIDIYCRSTLLRLPDCEKRERGTQIAPLTGHVKSASCLELSIKLNVKRASDISSSPRSTSHDTNSFCMSRKPGFGARALETAKGVALAHASQWRKGSSVHPGGEPLCSDRALSVCKQAAPVRHPRAADGLERLGVYKNPLDRITALDHFRESCLSGWVTPLPRNTKNRVRKLQHPVFYCLKVLKPQRST